MTRREAMGAVAAAGAAGAPNTTLLGAAAGRNDAAAARLLDIQVTDPASPCLWAARPIWNSLRPLVTQAFALIRG